MTAHCRQILSSVEAERVILRPLALDDAAAFRAMTDDPAITAMISFLPTPFTLADARRLIADDDEGRNRFCGVWLRDTNALIGAVGVHLLGADEIEIGYWLARSARGRGFAGQAVSAMVGALQAAYPLRRIIAE